MTKKLCLTGTPMPHDITDIYGQYRFLNPQVFGASWHAFRNTFCTFKQIPGVPAKIVSGHQNLDYFQEKLSRLMVQVTEYDLDLPEVTHDYRLCQLSPKARRIYKGIQDDLIAEIDSGVVTAANALVKSIRLQQVTSGYAVEDETGNVEQIDHSKRQALEELLDSLHQREPVVVFCYFRHDLEQVRFAAKTGGRRYGELSGNRRDLTEHSTMPEDIDVMGVQLKSGGVGIDLTRAAYGVYFNTGTISSGDYDQTVKRLHRPGQTRPVVFYHLIADRTIDQHIYKARQNQGDLIAAVIEGMRER